MTWKAKPVDKIDRRTKAVVGIRWEFTHYNEEKKRNDRVPVEQIPKHIRESQSHEEVEAYIKSQNALEDAIKYRAEMLREWENKFHDFKEYLQKFAEYQRERAPNSWENDVFYLKNYAFGFFMSKSNLNNINTWCHMFEDFRVWLRDVKPLKQKKDKLALNTQIKIIKALNRFLAFCFTKGWILNVPKCPGYAREDTNTVTAEDLFRDEELPLLRQVLEEIRPISAEFFVVLTNTALRENEGLGLSLDFVTEGKLEGPKTSRIHDYLEKYGLGEYHGYICLESQPAKKAIRISEKWTDRHGVTWMPGSVPRKPLKHRKKIDPKWYRYIPIFNVDAWNIIARRANEASERFERKVHGSDAKDYLLFDGLTASVFYSDLAEALRILKLRHRSPHKTRHTFLTWFYDRIGEDIFLAEKVGGHRDKRDVERYNHISELIGRERKAKQQLGKKFKIK